MKFCNHILTKLIFLFLFPKEDILQLKDKSFLQTTLLLMIGKWKLIQKKTPMAYRIWIFFKTTQISQCGEILGFELMRVDCSIIKCKWICQTFICINNNDTKIRYLMSLPDMSGNK